MTDGISFTEFAASEIGTGIKELNLMPVAVRSVKDGYQPAIVIQITDTNDDLHTFNLTSSTDFDLTVEALIEALEAARSDAQNNALASRVMRDD